VLDPPDYRTLRQWNWNDCWFLSALVGMAYQRPDQLCTMATDLGGGSYQVAFPNQPVQDVAPTDPGGGTGSGPWPWGWVFETAAGKLTDLQAGRVFTYGYGIELLTGKGRTGRTNLTGMGFAPLHVLSKRAWFRDYLTELAGTRLMVLGGTDGTFTKPLYDWITPQHCYALLGYDRDADRVRVRDPRGEDHPDAADRKAADYGPGEFWLTAAETEDCFCGLTVEDE